MILLSDTPRFPPHQGNQFAGIFFGDSQAGMDQGTKARLGKIPFPAETFRKVDGACRAKVVADAAPFTLERIDHKIRRNGTETAPFQTVFTLGTALGVDVSFMPGPEIMTLHNGGREEQMQVCGIHIRIAKNLSPCQRCKGSHNTGFPRSAFSTDDDKLFHWLPSLPLPHPP
jgi:hypothetical protein